MRTFAFLAVAGLALIAADTRAEPTNAWRLVCQHDASVGEPRCHVAFFADSQSGRPWVAMAVEVHDGAPEIQVTAKGQAFRSAEIDVIADTTVMTDYCYESYCVFVNAQDLIEQFRAKTGASVRIYNGADRPAVEQRVSLMGFSRAYDEYLTVVGE